MRALASLPSMIALQAKSLSMLQCCLCCFLCKDVASMCCHVNLLFSDTHVTNRVLAWLCPAQQASFLVLEACEGAAWVLSWTLLPSFHQQPSALLQAQLWRPQATVVLSCPCWRRLGPPRSRQLSWLLWTPLQHALAATSRVSTGALAGGLCERIPVGTSGHLATAVLVPHCPKL